MLNKISTLARLTVGAVISMLSVCPIAASAQLALQSGKEKLTGRIVNPTSDIDWEGDRWTGDDRPFAAARLYIDRVFSAGGDIAGLAAAYKGIASSKPNDALSQFQWAYATYMWGDIPHPVHRDASDIAPALAIAPNPHTYNYDRIRLLCNGVSLRDRKLVERLLAYNPADPRLQEDYAGLLSTAVSRDDHAKAIRIAEGIVTKGVDSPTCYGTLGDVYYVVGFLENKPEYYHKSVDVLRKELVVMDKNDWHRAVVEHSISYQTALLAKGGK